MPPSRNHTRCGELTSPRRLQQQGRRNSSHAFVQLPLTTIPLIQARQSRAKSAVTHNNNPNKMRPKRSSFAITLSLSLSLSLFALCLGEDGRAWFLRCERGDGLLDRIHGLQATVIGLAVRKGETASWTEMMACNSRGWAGVFSVKRGEKGLLDRNDGLQFKALGWGFQCKKGRKRPSGQK
jgi:hypothetical protein